ncbi:MAG: ABC transporter permease [Gammaproteobacteria bacterium]|nr:ABC transporter permease [Gammaproteobacteria bacterium]
MLSGFINLSDPLLVQVLMAFFETLELILIPGLLAIIFGGALGLVLYILRPNQDLFKQYSYSKYLYNLLDFVVNIGRSIPFIILMIAILPFTRLIAGTTIGTLAACVPLTIAAIPFMARIVENACINVNRGVIEAAHSMGASTTQIVFYVVLPESKINIINGIGIMLIALVGYSSMAGTLAGGGLGALAFNYGYQRFNNTVILITVVLILLIVQIIQYLNNRICKYYSHK